MLIGLIGQWGHVFAAIAFGLLTLWSTRLWLKTKTSLPLSIASALTVLWALCFAMAGPNALASWMAESLRDLGWVGYMISLWRSATKQRGSNGAVKLLYGVLVCVIVGRVGVDVMPIALAGSPRMIEAAFYAAIILRMISSVGALLLVHNLYTAATSQTRTAIRWPMIALTVMWVYDLNLDTITYLSHNVPLILVAMRGVIIALLAPLFALGIARFGQTEVKLSRSVTFQSLSLVGVGLYLILMVGGSALLQLAGEDYVRAFQVSFVFLSALAALIILPNQKIRAWMRVMLAKHLFQHRYDYRAEWLRFTNTLSRADETAAALNARAIKAVADITESSAGLLIGSDGAGGLTLQARWNWPDIDVPLRAAGSETIAYFLKTGRILELSAARRDDVPDEEARAIPEWMTANPRAWVVVPLIHFDTLAGLVVLDRPILDRELDWEDFDLLRVAGRQVASYLAEAKGQEALSDVQHFDEFNRRFAFIMHDIKNLVSQLSLVSRNAERHIGNPAFQRDMLATLDNSTKRMNDLLRRLSQHNKGRPEEPRPIPLGALVDAVSTPKRAHHPIVISGDMSLFGVADPSRLEQALGHLIQNAIDASAPTDPVTVHIARVSDQPCISIIDTGVGMSADFIREQLFKPFNSTKEGGFGIGAYEARTLILAMGGRLDVKSRVGKGCTFTITLPTAVAAAPSLNEDIAA